MDGIVCLVLICLPIDSNHCRQSSFSQHLFFIIRSDHIIESFKTESFQERNDCVPSVLLPQPILCTSRVELVVSSVCECPAGSQEFSNIDFVVRKYRTRPHLDRNNDDIYICTSISFTDNSLQLHIITYLTFLGLKSIKLNSVRKKVLFF